MQLHGYTMEPASGGVAAAPRRAVLPKAKPTSTKTPKASSSPSASSSASPSSSPSASASSSPTSNPNAPMTAQQAHAYCASHLNAVNMLLLGSSCTKKLTGMTPAEADQGWAANKNNLAAWFRS